MISVILSRVVKLIGLCMILAALYFAFEQESFIGFQGSGYSIGFGLSTGILLPLGTGILLFIKSKWLAQLLIRRFKT